MHESYIHKGQLLHRVSDYLASFRGLCFVALFT